MPAGRHDVSRAGAELPVCVRCGRPVLVNRELYESVFERMHRLCFHLEYEHPGDPDQPCSDPSCYLKAVFPKESP